jgi:hypothetical protein
MSRYILIRRLWAPAFVLLVGVMALLSQANILGWSQSWPLFLILAGLLMLAERAALAAEGFPHPGAPGPASAHPATGPGGPQSAGAPAPASVPSEPENFGDHQSGAQS